MHQRTLREVASWKWLQLIIVPNGLDKCTTNNANYDEDDEDYEDDDEDDDENDDEDDDEDDGHGDR